jgi:mannan endo-1,4-beta-mannosidase
LENKVPETLLGLYLPENYSSAPRRALQYQQFWAKKIHILSFYSAWGKGTGRPDLAGIEAVLKNGFLPMITWEPWHLPELSKGARPEDQPDFSLSSILSGKYEEYIWNWVLDLQKVPSPILFRPMHEMNGNWYPWCGKVNGNTPEEYIETWRYLRSIFRRAKSNKTIWVWSPYAHSVPDEPDNDILQYFPGMQEVDWLALDGYNWGMSREWSRWQSFQDIFEKSYDRLTKFVPEKPMMIAEVGCAEDGGDKGSWIEEAAGILRKRFSRIKAVVWFNIRKECDWRIESSEKSLISFRRNWDPM